MDERRPEALREATEPSNHRSGGNDQSGDEALDEHRDDAKADRHEGLHEELLASILRVGYQLALDLDAAGPRLLGLGNPESQHPVVERRLDAVRTRSPGQRYAIVEPAGTPSAPA